MKEVVNSQNSHLIDVRTPDEYREDHVEGSTNIPLDEVPDRLDQFREMEGPIVLFCRSGMRSQQALEWLESQGVENLHNAGGYMDVRKMRN